MKYKVEHLQDDTYRIVCPDDVFRTIYFQGSLADCQAWIWLTEHDNI